MSISRSIRAVCLRFSERGVRLVRENGARLGDLSHARGLVIGLKRFPLVIGLARKLWLKAQTKQF